MTDFLSNNPTASMAQVFQAMNAVSFLPSGESPQSPLTALLIHDHVPQVTLRAEGACSLARCDQPAPTASQNLKT